MKIENLEESIEDSDICSAKIVFYIVILKG
jgi:hypothetical protein